MTRRWLQRTAFLALCGLLLPSGARADEEVSPPAAPTIRVLGARVRPLRPDGTAWDGDHRKIPRLVYEVGGRLAGFPGLGLLASIPYRNRPDPRLEVRQGEAVLGRQGPVQGSFLPTFLLTVEPKLAAGASRVVTFVLTDDDLKDDDPIGKAMLDLDRALEHPGLHVLEGTGGLHDLTLVLRHPALRPEAPLRRIVVESARVTVRPQRPAGGDWDAGGNPVGDKLRRLPHGEKLQGLESAKPDVDVVLLWSSGDARALALAKDAFEQQAEDLAWRVEGREGVGDGLFVRVTDQDSLADDPIGVVYIPLETLLEHAAEGRLRVDADESNGVATVELAYRVEYAAGSD